MSWCLEHMSQHDSTFSIVVPKLGGEIICSTGNENTKDKINEVVAKRIKQYYSLQFFDGYPNVFQ